jgi:hypothetical protein
VTERLQDWLPAEAAVRPAVRAAVEPVVAAWAAHWFARGEARLDDWTLAAGGRPAFDAGWRACGGGLEASCSTRAAGRLASLALDARPDGMDVNDRDRLVMAALARRIVDDLAQRVDGLLGREGAAPPGDRRLVATVAESADVLFSLSIPVTRLLGLSRRVLPRAGSATPLADGRRAALAATTVRLEATLGAATLTLAEARELSVGDILLLDRTLRDAADLTLPRSADVVARGVLTETEGCLALVLQPAS